MTRSASPADLAAIAEPLVPAGVLKDGETVLLAIKPSGWFVLLVSWPVLAVVALVALGLYLLWRYIGVNLPLNAAMCLCLAVACIRITVACMQWLGRMYILTDRRIMSVRGAVRSDVASWMLKDIRQLALSAGRADKLLGIASLLVVAGSDDVPQPAWTHLARPIEVHRIVSEAAGRAL